MPEIEVNKRQVFYRVGGKNLEEGSPSLVFIHGAGGSSAQWLYQLRTLRKQAYCFAIDLPGHGKSEDASGCDTVDGIAAFILATLDALEISRCILIGHALGGAASLIAVRAQPEKFSALCVVSCGPTLSVSPLILEALRGSLSLWSHFMEDLLFSPATPQRFVEKSSGGGLQAPREVLLRDFNASALVSLRPHLGEILLPTFVLAGHDDALTPLPLCEALSDALPNATLEIIEEAGHMMMLERHKRFNALLIRFIQGLDTP